MKHLYCIVQTLLNGSLFISSSMIFDTVTYSVHLRLFTDSSESKNSDHVCSKDFIDSENTSFFRTEMRAFRCSFIITFLLCDNQRHADLRTQKALRKSLLRGQTRRRASLSASSSSVTKHSGCSLPLKATLPSNFWRRLKPERND